MVLFQRMRHAMMLRRTRARQQNQFRRFTMLKARSFTSHPQVRQRPRSFQLVLRQQSRVLLQKTKHPTQTQRHQQQIQPQLGHFGNRRNSRVRQPITWTAKQSPMGLVNNNTTNTSTKQQMVRGTQIQQFYESKTKLLRKRRLRRGGKTISLNTDSALWRSIGMRLSEKLKPNRERIDLFNKELRSQITRNYILSNNGLQNIGGNLKKASDYELPFPNQMIPMFAISIRPTRFDNLRARLGPWERHLQHWQGTLGAMLDKNKMVKDGIAVPRLKRGEIGCYDAHYRLWKHMVDTNLNHAFILEDDADIQYGQYFIDRVNQLFSDIQKQNAQYDVIYLGHNTNKRPRKQVGCLGVPGGVQGLFAYYLTLEGARKLIAHAIPMTQAVDDYVYVSRFMRQLTLEPRLCWVVPIEQSDTANIF